MRSKTSCFNGTLLRKDLGRFWPLWCAYLAVWLVAVPLNQFLTLFGTSIRYYTPIQLVDVAVSNLLDMGTEFGMWMGLISGCFFAMALFSYLCSARSVGMMHSFPIRREGLFFTHYLAGCIVFLSSLVITGLLTAAVQGAAGVLEWRNIGLFFLCAAGQMLFFYSFAVFCTMFTGQILAMPVFYAALNVVAMALCQAVQTLGSMFLYGYSGGGTPAWVRWLTPPYQLLSRLETTGTWNEELGCNVDRTVEGLGTLGVYVLAGLVLAGAALAVYRVRRSETAGDVVAVSWARHLFRFGVGICAALMVGQWLYYLIWSEFFEESVKSPALPLALVCMVVLGLVGFFGAEMLLCKSFRVLRSGWKGAVVVTAVVLALGIGVGLDVTGVESRVPDAAAVKSVEFSIGGNTYLTGIVKDPDTVEQFLQLHREMVADKKEEQLRKVRFYAGDPDKVQETTGQCTVTLRYQLGRTQMRRSYELFYPYEEVNDPTSLIAQMGALVQEPAVQRAALLDGSSLTEQEVLDHLAGGSMIYAQTIYADGGWSSSSYPFEGKVAQAVLEAILRDIDAGRAGGTMFAEDGWEQTYENSLEFWYTQGDGMSSLDIGITPAYTETIAVLRQYGIVSDQRPLMTNRELSDLSNQAADQPNRQDGYELQTLLENPGTGFSVSWPADYEAEANP
ncbi:MULTISPECIES: hypothetical protein [environmental samples]|uniref:hypothetical protein n=1 Tax=environmental samples TaxID=876090 RepID=UPI000339B1C3|nr:MULTISPECIES: hypothetical protein [environmental samples]CDC73576.1 putative uncharacterized protein [Oscillibacter sp. CAG:155]